MEGKADAGSNHLLDGETVGVGVEAVELGAKDAPGLTVVGVEHEYGTGFGGVGVDLAFTGGAFGFTGVRAANDIHECCAEAVKADSVFEPGGKAADPDQEWREVGFAPGGTNRFVGCVVEHEALLFGVGVVGIPAVCAGCAG